MKRNPPKSAKSINTPNPHCEKNENLHAYLKNYRQHQRYLNAPSTTTNANYSSNKSQTSRQDNFSSPMNITQKGTATSQTPNGNSTKILFFKNRPNPGSVSNDAKENLNPNLPHGLKRDRLTLDKLDKISSDLITNAKNEKRLSTGLTISQQQSSNTNGNLKKSVTPRSNINPLSKPNKPATTDPLSGFHSVSVQNPSTTTKNMYTQQQQQNEVTGTTPKRELSAPRRPSPGHVKSRSITKTPSNSRYENKKGTPSHNPKTHSVSSIDNLFKPGSSALGSNMTTNSSLNNSKTFQFASKDFGTDINNTSIDDVSSNKLDASEKCVNHPHKKAKYNVYSDNDEIDKTLKYCSKCAIKLAGNGVKVQEIVTNDDQLRKTKVDEFMIVLNNFKQNTTGLLNSILKKKVDLTEFYQNQEKKAEQIFESLLNVIKEEKEKSMKVLLDTKSKAFQEIENIESAIKGTLIESNEINADINKNFDKIVKIADVESLTRILGKYETKVNSYELKVQEFKSKHLRIHKLPSFSPNSIEKLRPVFANFYSLVQLATSVMKKGENLSQFSRRNSLETKHIPNSAADSTNNLNKSSIYISFENKDMFENAINQSIDAQSSASNRRQSNATTYNTVNESKTNPLNLSSSKMNNSSSFHLNSTAANSGSMSTIATFKSGEIKVKKTDIDLEEFLNKKSPSDNNKSSKTVTNSSGSVVISSQHMGSTTMLGSNQKKLVSSNDGLIQASIEINNSGAYGGSGGKSLKKGSSNKKKVSNSAKKCNVSSSSSSGEKLEGAKENPLYSSSVCDNNISKESLKNSKEMTAAISSIQNGSKSTSSKYANFLEKINASQTKKSLYYTKIIKTNPLISPRYNKVNNSDYDLESNRAEKADRAESCDIKMFTPTSAYANDSLCERSPPGNTSNSVMNQGSIQTTGFVSPPPQDPSKISQNNSAANLNPDSQTAKKEVKNYGDLVFMIQNNEDKQHPNNHQRNYQKTLFCSPNFKENIQTQESES